MVRQDFKLESFFFFFFCQFRFQRLVLLSFATIDRVLCSEVVIVRRGKFSMVQNKFGQPFLPRYVTMIRQQVKKTPYM